MWAAWKPTSLSPISSTSCSPASSSRAWNRSAWRPWPACSTSPAWPWRSPACFPRAGLYADPSLRGQIERTPGVVLLSAGSALVVWLVVWYFASHLSTMVRERDSQLDETNRRLVEAQREKSRHMLLTAHELKAPFAAIHANVHLLLHGHCGSLPTEATEALNRIAGRCRRLAAQIQEMLQLANIETPEEMHVALGGPGPDGGASVVAGGGSAAGRGARGRGGA